MTTLTAPQADLDALHTPAAAADAMCAHLAGSSALLHGFLD